MAFQFDSRRYPVTDIIEESEMTEAFALFERNPQRCISAAKTGSAHDIAAISKAIIEDRPKARRAGCAYAVADGLSVISLRSKQGALSPLDSQATMYAINAFNSLEPEFYEMRKPFQVRVRSGKCEDLIYKWASQATRNVIQQTNRDMAVPLLITICTAYDFLSTGDSRRDIDDQGILTILRDLASLWPLKRHKDEEVLVSKALSSIIFRREHAWESVGCMFGLDLITVDDDKYDFHSPLRTAALRLRKASNGNAIIHFEMLIALQCSFIYHINHLKECTIGDLFGKHVSVVSAIFKCVSRELDRHVRHDDPFEFTKQEADAIDADVISYGLTCLHTSLIAVKDLKCLRHVLKAGLMKILVFVSMPILHRRLSENAQKAITNIIGIIEQSLVIRRILKDVCKGMEWFGSVELHNCGCAGHCMLGVFFEEAQSPTGWVSLLNTMKHIYVAFTTFRRVRNLDVVKCGNVCCDRHGPRRMFKKCQRCLITFFCSNQCLDIAVRQHAHQSDCQRYQELFVSSGLRPREMYLMARYAHELARKGLYVSEDELAKSIAKGSTMDQRGVNVNFAIKPGKETVGQFLKESFEQQIKGMDVSIHYPLGYTNDQPARAPIVDENGNILREGTFETMIVVHYIFGGQSKLLLVDALFSEAILERRECTCCRLHPTSRDYHEKEKCPVHQGEDSSEEVD